MYKLCFFVPESHLEQVKSALFAIGVGKIGNYDCCCWQVKGQGQFRALAGSQPFIGQQGEVERVEEFKVEMVCRDGLIEDAVATLLESHPYETPAYEVFEMANY